MKNKIILFPLFCFLLVILLLPNTLAAISFGGPSPKYNLGEKISIDLSVYSASSYEGVIELTLECDSDVYSVYKEYIEVKPNIEESKTAIYKVSPSRTGQCIIRARIEDSRGDEIEQATTQEFLITNIVPTDVSTEKTHYIPGDTLKIKGTVRKADGYFDGTCAITLLGKGYSCVVQNSSFEKEIVLWEDIIPGRTIMGVSVADEDGNVGTKEKVIYIEQFPSTLKLFKSNQRFMPGQTLEDKAILYDQVDNKMNGSVTIYLISPGKEEIMKKVMFAQEKIIYTFPSDALPGDWVLEAYSDELEAKESIYVEEYEAISAEIVNSTLTVKNVGNVPYQKQIEITVKNGNNSEVNIEDISLEVNKEISFELKAPKGDYDVYVKAGDTEESFKGIPLTGRVIKIDNLETRGTNEKRFILALIIFAVLIEIAVFSALKVRRISQKKQAKVDDAMYQGHVQKMKDRAEFKKQIKQKKEGGDNNGRPWWMHD